MSRQEELTQVANFLEEAFKLAKIRITTLPLAQGQFRRILASF
jgi:hypothetical protein